jgi:DNA invertase Pin-like site-specific DNA recombinase
MGTTAIYARVSDDKKKADGERRQDVQRQVSLLEKSAPEQSKQYIDDGKSAFTDDINQRPAFKQLMNDCRRNFVQIIYVEDLTRFSRNLSLGLQWLKELGELGVQLISLKDGEIEVTSAKGWMQSTILLMFAEWDSRVKSEKVRSGMQKAKNLGKRIGGSRVGRKPNQIIKETTGLAEVSPKVHDPYSKELNNDKGEFR